MKEFIFLVFILLVVFSLLYIRKIFINARAKHPTFRNVNNGKIYCKLRDCKIIINGECVDGVMYGSSSKIIFAREKSDFESNFIRIK